MISGFQSHILLEELEHAIMDWLDKGDVKNLEKVALLGFSDLMLGLIDHTKHRASIKFLRMLPSYQQKIDAIHMAVERQDLHTLKLLVTKHKLALARDRTGTTLLHKAVLGNDFPIVVWLLNKFPRIIDVQDHSKRTALHYAAVLHNDNSDKIFQFLVNAGANTHIKDRDNRTPRDYLQNPNLLDRMMLRCFCNKKSQSMTQQFNYLMSMWLREGRVVKLAQLVFSGCGDVLLGRQSSHPASQAFLQEVPSLLAKIKLIHDSIISGEEEKVISLIVAKKWAIARNQQGATPLHTAVNHCQLNILKSILQRFPETVNAKDYKLRTPLHYAAGRGVEDECYKYLIEIGADPNIRDSEGHQPSYYTKYPSNLGFRVSREVSFEIADASDVSSLDSEDNLEVDMKNGAPVKMESFEQYFEDSVHEDSIAPLIDYKLKLARNLPISSTSQDVLQVVGKPLLQALVDVAIQRPLRPVSYIASVLKGYVTK